MKSARKPRRGYRKRAGVGVRDGEETWCAHAPVVLLVWRARTALRHGTKKVPSRPMREWCSLSPFVPWPQRGVCTLLNSGGMSRSLRNSFVVAMSRIVRCRTHVLDVYAHTCPGVPCQLAASGPWHDTSIGQTTVSWHWYYRRRRLQKNALSKLLRRKEGVEDGQFCASDSAVCMSVASSAIGKRRDGTTSQQP